MLGVQWEQGKGKRRENIRQTESAEHTRRVGGIFTRGGQPLYSFKREEKVGHFAGSLPCRYTASRRYRHRNELTSLQRGEVPICPSPGPPKPTEA